MAAEGPHANFSRVVHRFRFIDNIFSKLESQSQCKCHGYSSKKLNKLNETHVMVRTYLRDIPYKGYFFLIGARLISNGEMNQKSVVLYF